MNPLTNVKNIQKLNERMLEMGVEDSQAWHKQYKDSAYIFIGGLPYGLTEGDILCVFSQYGEIVNVNLVRDKKTGKTKGFCFLCYEDQRSTILAVDNFNGIKLGGRTIRVDHCSNYRRPKSDEKDEHGNYKEIIEEGCAPKTPPPSPPQSNDKGDNREILKKSKEKKQKTQKKTKDQKSENMKRSMTSSSEDKGGQEDKQELDALKVKFARKERLQNRTEEIDRDENGRTAPYDHKSREYKDRRSRVHNDHNIGKLHKGDDLAYNSRSNYEHQQHKQKDHKFEYKHDCGRSYHDRDQLKADDRRVQKYTYDRSCNDRDLGFDKSRRDRSNKRGDHRVDEGRSYEKHRSHYGDHKERRE